MFSLSSPSQVGKSVIYVFICLWCFPYLFPLPRTSSPSPHLHSLVMTMTTMTWTGWASPHSPRRPSFEDGVWLPMWWGNEKQSRTQFSRPVERICQWMILRSVQLGNAATTSRRLSGRWPWSSPGGWEWQRCLSGLAVLGAVCLMFCSSVWEWRRQTAKCQNIGLKCELDTLLSELFRTGAVKIIVIRIVTAKSDRNYPTLLSTLAAD